MSEFMIPEIRAAYLDRTDTIGNSFTRVFLDIPQIASFGGDIKPGGNHGDSSPILIPHHLSVHEPYRKLGIGTELVRYLGEIASNRGVEEILTTVTSACELRIYTALYGSESIRFFQGFAHNARNAMTLSPEEVISSLRHSRAGTPLPSSSMAVTIAR
jgi:GNAT superfamily N-acetyltransferase